MPFFLAEVVLGNNEGFDLKNYSFWYYNTGFFFKHEEITASSHSKSALKTQVEVIVKIHFCLAKALTASRKRFWPGIKSNALLDA